MQQRDKLVLEKIIDFCNRVCNYIDRNNNDYKLFCSDKMFQDACLMCVIEIGELSVNKDLPVLKNECEKLLVLVNKN